MASTNLSSLEPLEAYVSPDELADELVLQKTLLFTLDSTAEGSEQAKAEIEAEIARIETQLRELRGGVTEPHIGASVLGGSSQQHRPNNIESSSPFSSYNLSPFSCEFIPIVSSSLQISGPLSCYCIFSHLPNSHFYVTLSSQQD
jgi:hypothetical protein